jgi:acetoin utilization deacetylase AcuC-like enzyme
VLLFHHQSSLHHDPRALSPDHPDRPERLHAIQAALTEAGWLGCELVQAPAATPAQLALVHAPEHIDSVRRLCEAGGGHIDEDTFVDETSYHAALHAAGGAMEMVRALLGGEAHTAFSAMRPSGHHAERDRAMGFCLFNNVAVAAELAIRELGLERVFVLDWDVHHGNGTASIFRHRPDVLFASIHQSNLYPGTGSVNDAGSGAGLGYTINIPVPRGSDDEVWLSVLEHVIIPAAQEFRPQLVLISAGFDGHHRDPLSDCRLEADSFGQMAAQVHDLGAAVRAPVGAVLEGGYEPSALAESMLTTIRGLKGEIASESIAPDRLVTSRAAAHVGHFWSL